MFKHIRTKFIILLVLTGLLPLIVGTGIYISTSKQEIEEETEYALLQELSHVSFAIETIFMKARTNLLLASGNPAFIRYFTERKEEWGLEQVKTLRQLQLFFPEAISVTAFADVSGKEITKVVVKKVVPKERLSYLSEEDFFVPGLSQPPGGVFQGEPFVNPETRHWVIPFVAPVYHMGKIMGILYFDLNLEYFSHKLKGNISPENHAFLIERSGKILAQTIISIGETQGLPQIADLDQSPFFKALLSDILKGKRGVKRFTTSKGREYLVSFKSVPASQWSVMVITPLTRNFFTIIPPGKALPIFVATFIFIILIAFIMGKRFTDPVKEVVAGTSIISMGDFSYRIKTTLNDELGELAKSFNKMGEYLHKTYQDLKSTNAQLTQSAKLAAVGELAAGVAHELNQPLMVIRGYAQELLDGDSLPDWLIKDIKLIENQTTRMMKIIDHLRTFARQSSGNFEQVNINNIIVDSFILITQQLRNHNIEIIKDLDKDIPNIWGDPNRLEQVFLNIITNAKDAMDEKGGGTLTVMTRTIYKGDNNNKNPSGIRVIFRDTGIGISEDIIDKIFDPFFTTKEVGKGTGLGLSIGYSIIKDHGGIIDVKSNVGIGTEFIIEFPVERRKVPRKPGKKVSDKFIHRRYEI